MADSVRPTERAYDQLRDELKFTVDHGQVVFWQRTKTQVASGEIELIWEARATRPATHQETELWDRAIRATKCFQMLENEGW